MTQFHLTLIGKHRGYPIGTIAYYGTPENGAHKAVASVHPAAGMPASAVRRWEGTDLVRDAKVQKKIREFFKEHDVRTMMMTDRPMPDPTAATVAPEPE